MYKYYYVRMARQEENTAYLIYEKNHQVIIDSNINIASGP